MYTTPFSMLLSPYFIFLFFQCTRFANQWKLFLTLGEWTSLVHFSSAYSSSFSSWWQSKNENTVTVYVCVCVWVTMVIVVGLVLWESLLYHQHVSVQGPFIQLRPLLWINCLLVTGFFRSLLYLIHRCENHKRSPFPLCRLEFCASTYNRQ